VGRGLAAPAHPAFSIPGVSPAPGKYGGS